MSDKAEIDELLEKAHGELYWAQRMLGSAETHDHYDDIMGYLNAADVYNLQAYKQVEVMRDYAPDEEEE